MTLDVEPLVGGWRVLVVVCKKRDGWRVGGCWWLSVNKRDGWRVGGYWCLSVNKTVGWRVGGCWSKLSLGVEFLGIEELINGADEYE